ncbi:MAG: hypothetical protein P8R54_23105 [Myxococcota bacterium]|nr:hypothetical protein [Myxococcota bacterium]
MAVITPLLLVLGCGSETPDPAPSPVGDVETTPEAVTEAAPEALSATRLLIRASLDLRGVRPSIVELEAVEADPSQLDGLIADFLYDERFADQIVALYAEIYQTQSDIPRVGYGDKTSDYPRMVASMGQEPLRILAHIADHDLPYTEISTADWTMANEYIAEVWPVDYPEGETGWQQVEYTDDRPAAGILSTNALWWRYTTTYANANRGRANAISRLMFCNDYLLRPIEFDRDVNLLDAGAINEALKTNEGCIGCHSTLDPMASYLWGFYFEPDSPSELDATYYHPEREYWWQESTDIQPAFYGVPSYNIEDLGQQIAGDSRLPECITEQTFSQLLQRDVTLEDTTALTALREGFLSDELLLRKLIHAIMSRPEYRSASEEDGGTPYKLPRPDLLASQIEDLTGFRFTYADYDMLTTDTYGLRTLAGGIDGGFVTAPAPEINATMSLVYERLAQAASYYVVKSDKADLENARLFTLIGFTETPATNIEAITAQIQVLHFRLLGTRIEADGPEVAANIELWDDIFEAEGDPAAAWAGLLSVLLRDPEFLFY